MCATSLVLLTILAQATPLPADPQAKAQAQALLGQGTQLYQQGDVAGALERFEAAYVAFPSPKLMFNIGQANRDLSRPVEALQAFEKFLADATDASADTIADAHKSAAELQKELGRIRVDCDMAGAEVSLDGKGVGLTPLSELTWATPGRHQVTASHAGAAPAIENVDVTAGSVSTVTMRFGSPALPVAAGPVPPPEVAPKLDLQVPRPSDASHGWWLGRKWTWVAAGSTVLLVVGAITAGVLMQDKFDSLNGSCGSASKDPTIGCSQSDIDSVSTRQTTANVFWILTGAAAVTTGVLFFVEGSPVTVAPVAGGMTGLSAALRY